MKKAIIVLLAAILALSVVGCGCKKNNAESTGAASSSGVSVGDTIKFGKYEQDNDTSNGKEDIEWVALAIEGNKALVISKYALDSQRYDASLNVEVTWEICTLRTWLNGTFLNEAFSAEEQNRIINTTVTADANPDYDISSGNNTTDKVFLLSITEIYQYKLIDQNSHSETVECEPTAYAINQGVNTSTWSVEIGPCGTCWWWLRSPGGICDRAAIIFIDGNVQSFGLEVGNEQGAVRPAMWIDIGS